MFSNPNTYDNPRQGVRQPSFSNPTSFADTQGRGFPQYSTNNRQSSDEDTPPGQQYRNYEENNHTFKVMVRVRPALPRELESGQLVSTVQANNDKKRLTIYEYYNIDASDPDSQAKYLENTNMFTTHNFTFDNVFSPNSTQAEVYEHTAKPAVMSVLQGYNATILAYGQTGTGKTYSMEGFKFNCQDNQRGIIPRSMEEIFKYIENVSNSRTTFMVRVSYLQIYNEVISDLLRTDRSNMHIREDKKKGVFVEGLSEWAVRSPNEIYSLIQKGALSRATAATKMNDLSSRSHAVFIIIVEQMVTSQDAETGEEIKDIRVGKLNLVDLAGSERVRVTGATGKRLEECKKINQSLSALGNVISALADMKQSKTHIPYRDSKITRLLEDSLGGNCITTMMAMISPTVESFGESLSTLKFANRAKNIKNAPIINEDVDQKALLRKYEAELKKLRSELDARNRGQNDKSVMQLEEDKKRAERDKVAAFQALEAQSKEFIQEREEKKKLEEKIGSMFSQMLVGGKKMEETPQFRTAIEQQQKIIRQQYENRLQDLEKERHAIEEDKAQVDRYKQLLLKQRDIMIALTTRLNERDETIVQLQEELDAYDRIHKENEEHLEIRDKRIYELASTLKEHDIPLPKDSIGETEITGSILKNFSSNITGNEQQRYSVTQCEVVDNLQLQGDTEAAQAIETLKAQLASAQDRARRAEDEQSKLKDKLAQKDELLKNLQRQTNQGSGQESLVLMHKEIKANVDYIIESLSSQNEPQRLQAIARDLLNLQTLVNSAVAVTSSANTSGSPNSTASRSRGGNSGEAQSAGLPAEEKPEHQRSLSINRASSDKVPEQRLSINTRQASSNNLGDNETLKEQSENVIKPHTSQPSPLRGGDAKRSTDLRSLENKRSISTGIFGKYMGSLVNVESEKKAALTAEELLKMKKEQPAPKKKV